MFYRRILLRSTLSVCVLFSLLSFVSSAFANAGPNVLRPVQAEAFLGSEWMQGPYHSVSPNALSDGQMLLYTVMSREGETRIKGTLATQEFIREVCATEILRQRSTAGAILGSTKDRAVNLVETPTRLVKSVAGKVGDISSLEEAVLFVPKETVGVAGGLLGGVGELLVTGKRITRGATSTKCNGFNCVEKAGEDIWSGFNSLMGKHNAARELHQEFGTDPQTRNKAYRKQIDRIAYADSYTGTTIKLGVSNAGIEYLSPAMTGVGYYNNGEFVTGYEDAHRRRNFEKNQLVSWGVPREQAEAFYKNDVFTKAQRTRFFTALEAIDNDSMRRRLFNEAFVRKNFNSAKEDLFRADYIAAFDDQKAVRLYLPNEPEVALIANNGTRVIPVYADFLDVASNLSQRVLGMRGHGRTELHVIGTASNRLKAEARAKGIEVVEVRF